VQIGSWTFRGGACKANQSIRNVFPREGIAAGFNRSPLDLTELTEESLGS